MYEFNNLKNNKNGGLAMAEKDTETKVAEKCECDKRGRCRIVRLEIPKDYLFGNEMDEALSAAETGLSRLAQNVLLIVVGGESDGFRREIVRTFFLALKGYRGYMNECGTSQLEGCFVRGDRQYERELLAADGLLDICEAVRSPLNYGVRRLVNDPQLDFLSISPKALKTAPKIIAQHKERSEFMLRRRLKVKKGEKFTLARLFLCDCQQEGKDEKGQTQQ